MRLPLSCGILIMVGLSGCSSGGSDDGAEADDPAPVLPVAPPPPEPVLTDVMFLLDAPHMAGLLPLEKDPYRRPVPSTADSGDLLLWSMPRPAQGSLDGSAKIWVEVEGNFPNPGSATSGCFWNIVLRIDGPDGEVNAVGPDDCVSEPAFVETGVRALEVSFSDVDFRGAIGDQLSLWVSTNHFAAPPGASITALTGTPEFDSHLRIEGMQLPIDTTTLLAHY